MYEFLLTLFMMLFYIGGYRAMRNSKRGRADALGWPYHVAYWFVTEFLRDKTLF